MRCLSTNSILGVICQSIGYWKKTLENHLTSSMSIIIDHRLKQRESFRIIPHSQRLQLSLTCACLSGNRIQPNSHWNKNTVKLTLTPRKTADPLVVFPWTACRQLVTASLGHHFARANVPVRAFSKHWLLSSNNINPFRSRTYSICFKNWSFPSLIPPYNGQTLAFSW